CARTWRSSNSRSPIRSAPPWTRYSERYRCGVIPPAAAPKTPMHSKPFALHELNTIAAVTLAHYEQCAEEFRVATRDHDVGQNLASLLRHVEGEPPFTILDLGCGPGRDLKSLAALGHTAIGLDGAAVFVAMARAEASCEVWQQDFLR